MAIFPELRGQVVLITGAARGIGRATAQAFADQGSHLALVDIAAEEIQALAKELRQGREIRVRAFPTDVTVGGEVAAMADGVIAEFGQIDVLINSAGGYPRLATTAEVSEEEWDRIVDLNLKSVFLCCKAVLPHMTARRRGRIISIASQAGRTSISISSPPYAASKAGVINYMRHLAREVGSFGITANAIAPGTTLTERVAALRNPEQEQAIVRVTPLGRFARVEDHANTALFLASDGASFITGVTVDVNGGRLMM